jgi:sarcosine oxidase subunit alpha
MSQAWRLPEGGRVDRARPLCFRFDGRAMEGFAGDTLASALLANGLRLVARSFKYHRPRGILSAGSEEPNALVELDLGSGRREPNTRATTTPLTEGLVAHSQNRTPSLRFDLAAIAGLAAPLLPAGFYYKTFMGPGRDAWHRRWEPMIRRMAGLGRAPDAPDRDRYANRFAHCDVLVVGGGPAGIAAALAAAETGVRVILCDEQAEPGGTLLAAPTARIDGLPAWDWLAQALATLRAHPRVSVLTRTTAIQHGLQNFVLLAQLLDRPDGLRERLWQVRARQVILAAGAIERPIPFAGNDRPGVMLADAARAYATRWAVLPGRRVAACIAHDSGYGAAFALHEASAAVVSVIDRREAPPPELLDLARQRGIDVLAGHAVASTQGEQRIAGLRAAPCRADGTLDAKRMRTIACDLLLMAGGWTPSVHLFSQARGRLRWDAAADAFLPGKPVAGLTCVGACAGLRDLAAALETGHAAGRQAALASAPSRGCQGPRPSPAASAVAVRAAPHAAAGRAESSLSLAAIAAAAPATGPAFVDFQNDVTVGDIALAVREGFRSVEHVKRYTTAGMATDQGKVGGMLGLAIAAAAQGRDLAEAGLTTFRPPYTPVSFGALAGRHRGALFEPTRTAPLHGWAAAQGAVFERVGLWQRARYLPRSGEDMRDAVVRECRAVRGAAGLMDASTLGKIEVTGPDAAAFLDRCYATAIDSLAPGRCRYGLLLREDGFLLDDGIIARLAPDRFHVTTTTGGAARVLHMLEDYRQTEFPELVVRLTSTTEHWAVIALHGPRAAALLAPLVAGPDPRAMPHMTVAEAEVCGAPARLFRVSFTGEPGFEINVPAGHAETVWTTLWDAGQAHGVTAYGTEAMHVLRAEMGYIIVGQETDGTVTPDDLGLSWAVGARKRDFIGRRSLRLPDLRREDRLQLVGLAARDRTVPDESAQLVGAADGAPPSLGHVTSAYWSAVLDRPIALGLLARGRQRHGETVFATRLDGPPQALEVVAPQFLPPRGRQHG